jgi:hypothetical protein
MTRAENLAEGGFTLALEHMQNAYEDLQSFMRNYEALCKARKLKPKESIEDAVTEFYTAIEIFEAEGGF